MIKVLFVCIHNSARSQIAEAYLNKMAGDRFIAESAGIEPGTLNPLVVKSMLQEGLDISGNKTKSVFDFYKQGRIFDYVITVCDKKQPSAALYLSASHRGCTGHFRILQNLKVLKKKSWQKSRKSGTQ